MVEVCRTAILRYRLRDLPSEAVEKLRWILSLYKRVYVHLFWCRRLEIEPDSEVVKLMQALPCYFRRCLDPGSPMYVFKHVPANVKRTRVKPVLRLDCKVLTRSDRRDIGYAASIDLVRNVVKIRGLLPRKALELPFGRDFKRWVRDVLSTAQGKVRFTIVPVLRDDKLELHVTACQEVDPPNFIENPRQGRYVYLLVDVNSLYGIKTMFVLVDFDRRIVKLLSEPRYKPPSHRARRLYASHIQRLLKRLSNIYAIDGRKAAIWRFLYRQTLRKIRRVNRDFVNKTIHDIVTKLLRYSEKHSATPLVLIDKPDYESLHGDPILQQTLLRFVRLLENRLLWCGVAYREDIACSRRCFNCGQDMKLLEKTGRTRVYICNRCGIAIDRDQNACINLLLKYTNASFTKEHFLKLFQNTSAGNVAPCGLNPRSP